MTGISKKYGKASLNLLLAGIVVFAFVFVVPKILLLFMPFIIGWFLALLANPPVRFLEEKLKIRRNVGAVLVVVFICAGIVLFMYAVWNRLLKGIPDLLRILPRVWKDMELEFVGITKKWNEIISSLPEDVVKRANDVRESLGTEVGILVGELSFSTANAVSDFAGNIPGIMIAMIMSLLSAYFFVVQRNYLFCLFKKIIPPSRMRECILLKQTTVDVFIGYLKVQLKIELWIYLIIAGGFLFLKVRYGYLIAIVIALLDMLPVLGTGTVLIPWTVFEVLKGDYVYALGLLAIWGVSQLVRQMIQPKLIGDSMGMAPIPTLIHLYVGYKIAGMIGMLVAVPFGILVKTMDAAGFFNNTKMSVRILWQGLQNFRRFTQADFDVVENPNAEIEE